ncbi:MAG: DHH family phosphoesterase [Candidatus Gastranaerophilaceae bacterium]|jgi:nanoRNase/pAp phosphatase (c-di-AMP/oligoRNAs hydrolase)
MINKIETGLVQKYQKINLNPTESGYLAKSQFHASADTINLNSSNKVISFTGHNFAYRKTNNVINFISFKGLQNPQPLAIQMRVSGVQRNQSNLIAEESTSANDKSINKLAKSNWVDGQNLQFETKIVGRGQKFLILKDNQFGEIGRVPDEIMDTKLGKLLKDRSTCKDFKFQLSNVIAGMTKGAPTIGLRVNLFYTGKNPKVAEKIFNDVLNNPNCKEKVMLYQPKTSPEEVLKTIVNQNAIKTKDPQEAEKVETYIQNILSTIEKPKNKKVLLVGHCKPDGDTLGCVLGLKNAMALKYPDKQIDCAIDDKIPGLFRHTLPGIDGEIKRPVNETRIKDIQDEIKQLQAKSGDKQVSTEVEMLNEELKQMQNPENLLDPKAKYDLVIMMDVPTPERFSGAFKKYLVDENNQPREDVDTIYIDHHPHRIGEWRNATPTTGLDMDKAHKNNLAWIEDAVPAATELVGILANRMLPDLNKIANKEVSADQVFKKPGQLDKLKAFVAATITGMSTDTGSFLRTANLLPEDMLKPAQQRPNFLPEGMSKWLISLTDGIPGKIDKKWLREEISYDLNDNKIPELSLSARDTMLRYSIDGKIVPEDENGEKLGLGIVQVDYDQMFNVWDVARKSEKQEKGKAETTFLDVQNGFKYGEVMNILRTNPAKHGKGGPQSDSDGELEGLAKEIAESDYQSTYDEDRIAILICQDKKEGCLDEKLNIATQNGLRLSFRSQDGSTHSELLANLFGGGGHGGASGGRVDLPGVTLKTPLGVEIEGVKVNDPTKILEQLEENHKVMNNNDLSDEQKIATCKKVKVVLDNEGKPCADLINDLVVVIRKNQDAAKAEADTEEDVSFKGSSSISKLQSPKLSKIA